MRCFWMSGTRDFGNLRFLKNARVLFFKNPQKIGFLKMPPFSGSEIPLLAIHKIISHIWEDRSRKVNNDEPNLRFFHGNFWPVISQAVRKPCFSAWIPRGPNFWKPLTCGYVAAGAFFFPQKRGPIFLEALNLWVRCRRRLFFLRKMAPIFLEALSLWVRCRRRLFFSEKWAPYFWKPLIWGGLINKNVLWGL